MSYQGAPGHSRGPDAGARAPRDRQRGRGPAGLEGGPAGPYRPLSRLEITDAVPRESRRIRSQPEALSVFMRQPELGEARADRAANLRNVWRILVRRCDWRNKTSMPVIQCAQCRAGGDCRETRPRHAWCLCRAAGIARSTWKELRKWYREYGWLGTVREGRTPMLRAGVLTDPDAPNEAAIYVLCVPRSKPKPEPPIPAQQENRPLSGSERSEERIDPARAREISAIAPLRRGPGSRLSDGQVAAIARPWLNAGYSPAELRQAIEYQPGGRQHRARLDGILSPAHWLAWRLSRWTTEPDVAWQAYRELGRWAYLPVPVPLAPPSMAAWRDVTPIGQTFLARSRAKAAAARRFDPQSIIRGLREQHGWSQPQGGTT